MQMKRKDAALAPNTDSCGQRLPVWHEDEALCRATIKMRT